MSESYQTPIKRQRFEYVVKRSRFITTIDYVGERSAAQQFLSEIRQEFPDASHHCWAVITGGPKDSHGQNQSDDGEPKGTAGKPILNVLQHSGMGHIMAIVTRYFGGIKLGAGGLVRAYSSAASVAVQQLETQEHLILKQIIITLPYTLLDTLVHRLSDTRGKIIAREFTNEILLTLEFPIAEEAQIKQILSDFGHQKIKYSKEE